jgi:hypothetical protein
MKSARKPASPQVTATDFSTQLSEYKKTSIEFLDRGMPGRLLNDYPLNCKPADLKSFQAIYQKLDKFVPAPAPFQELFDLESEEDRKAIKNWVIDIAARICREILDGRGSLRWGWINRKENPRGLENFIDCYHRMGVEAIVASHFFSECMNACDQSAKMMNVQETDAVDVQVLKNKRYLSFWRWMKNYGEWVKDVISATQAKESRSIPEILTALQLDFENSLVGLQKIRGSAEKTILAKFVKNAASTEQSLLQYLTDMYSECMEQQLGSGLLARLTKHYMNKICIRISPDALSMAVLKQQKSSKDLKVPDEKKEAKKADSGTSVADPSIAAVDKPAVKLTVSQVTVTPTKSNAGSSETNSISVVGDDAKAVSADSAVSETAALQSTQVGSDKKAAPKQESELEETDEDSFEEVTDAKALADEIDKAHDAEFELDIDANAIEAEITAAEPDYDVVQKDGTVLYKFESAEGFFGFFFKKRVVEIPVMPISLPSPKHG